MDKQQGPTVETGDYIQYIVINHNEYEREYVCIYTHKYIYMNHSTVYQKLIQYCKSTIHKLLF